MEIYMGRRSPSLIETVERLRHVSGLDESSWLDLLNMTWKDYGLIRSGIREFSLNSLESLARHFGLAVDKLLLHGEIDFRKIQTSLDQGRWEMPEIYTKATHGRRRTTITSFEYLERTFGWRLRHDTLRYLGMSELVLENEFAPVSMRFITDVCAHLAQRRFQSQDFFNMGAYSYVGNRKTILSEVLGQLSSTREVFDHLWNDLMPLYERNCIYRFLELTDTQAQLEVVSDPHVAAEMGVKHLGNVHICALKAGVMATTPCYIGLPPATVHEKTCAHRGDDACLFEIQFPIFH